jgi:hypothetical protein
MQSGLHGTAGGERLHHEPRQGLHHEHPRRMVNLPDMVESSNCKRGRWGRSSPVHGGGAGQHQWSGKSATPPGAALR